MKKYKNCGHKDSMNALKLALIITGSIVAAAGIILIIMKFCRKNRMHKVHECCCDIDSEEADSWDIEDDVLTELELDDEDVEDTDTEESSDE